MADFTFRGVDTDSDIDRMAQILAWSFNSEAEDSKKWIERSGLERGRVVHRGDDLAACLFSVPMGQYFGGRSVPMIGIVGVGVAPEHRGRGAARHMMLETLRELRAAGGVISGLYPSVQGLYRSVGYQLSGVYFDVDVPLRTLTIDDRTLELRRFTDDDRPAVRALAADVFSKSDGTLDRGEYIWDRIENPRAKPANGYVVCGDDGLEGYVFCKNTPSTGTPPRYDIAITDMLAATAGAARRLWTFLGHHRTLGVRARWHAGPADPMLALLVEKHFEQRLNCVWMLRILDPKKAFEARGYRADARGKIELEIDDPLFEESSGRWKIEIEGTSARVERGGAGTIRSDIKGIAPLFSGYMSAEHLARAGWIEGDEAALATAARLLAGPTPWMADMF